MQDRDCSGHGSCALGKCYCQVSNIIINVFNIFNAIIIINIFNAIVIISTVVITIIIIIIAKVGWTGDSCEERNEQIFR